MRDVLLVGFVVACLPWAFARPQFGVLLWAAIGYLNPHRYTWGFAYNFPIVQVVALSTLAGLVFANRRTPFPRSTLTTLWILWVLWLSFTTLFALVPDSAFAAWDRALKIQIMILATLWLMGTRERIDATVWTIVLSIGIFGVKGGLFSILTGGQYRVWGPPDSFIEGNNELALALLIVMPLMRYLQLAVRERWSANERMRRWVRPVSWGLGAAMLLTGFSILASYSRGSLLGAAAMLLVLFLRVGGKWYVRPILIAVAVSTIAFMPQKWSERMTTIQTYQEDASALGRINAWWFAYNLAKDHPVVGGGFQTFDRQLFLRYAPNPTDFHDAHSIYFQALAEHGFVGLALFLALGAAALIAAGRTARVARQHPDLKWAADLCAMLQASLVGYAAGGAFLGLAYFDLPYHLIALIILCQMIVRRRLRELQAAGVGAGSSGHQFTSATPRSAPQPAGAGARP